MKRSTDLRRALGALAGATLLLTAAAACGSDDEGDDDAPVVEEGEQGDTGEGDTGSEELDQGSDEALQQIQDLVASGLESDFGPATVSCPAEIASGPGVYDCDAEFDDGSTGTVSVSTEGGSIDIVDVVTG